MLFIIFMENKNENVIDVNQLDINKIAEHIEYRMTDDYWKDSCENQVEIDNKVEQSKHEFISLFSTYYSTSITKSYILSVEDFDSFILEIEPERYGRPLTPTEIIKSYKNIDFNDDYFFDMGDNNFVSCTTNELLSKIDITDFVDYMINHENGIWLETFEQNMNINLNDNQFKLDEFQNNKSKMKI